MPDAKQQMLELWQKLSKKQKISIIGAASLVFISILVWSIWWGSKPDYTPLYTKLEAKDAGEIVNKLKEMKVSYEIGDQGASILVPSKDVYKVRMDLAGQGLPKGGTVGFEIFDQNKWGATEFQNKINLIQALQGELTRTIEQMSEVEHARVHIVLPEDSLYKKNEKPASASVMLKLRGSAQLTKEQVRGIVHLVCSGVQGLKPENVTIVDMYGNILNDQAAENELTGSGSITQYELQKKLQADLEKRVQTLLEQVLGSRKAVVRVNADLNFDKRAIDRYQYDPVIDDKGIVRSSQDMTETYRGTGQTSGGTPGVNANIPGYPAGGAGQSNYDKKEKIVNYEINKTEEKTVVAPGAIRRLTVAVIVDANLNNVQQDSITNAVSSAVGLNAARGDTITVESIPFSTEMEDQRKKEEQEAAKQQQQELWMKVGAGVVVVVVLFYLIRNFARRKQEEDELLKEQIMQFADQEVVEDKLSPEEEERRRQREIIEKMARQKPEDIAQLLKTWLSDE